MVVVGSSGRPPLDLHPDRRKKGGSERGGARQTGFRQVPNDGGSDKIRCEVSSLKDLSETWLKSIKIG